MNTRYCCGRSCLECESTENGLVSTERSRGYWFSLSQRSIFCWERGRLVRIERGARTVIAARSSKKGACFARCADGTSALPASSSLVGLKLNQYPFPSTSILSGYRVFVNNRFSITTIRKQCHAKRALPTTAL
jgi:hypothetical protein